MSSALICLYLPGQERVFMPFLVVIFNPGFEKFSKKAARRQFQASVVYIKASGVHKWKHMNNISVSSVTEQWVIYLELYFYSN